MDRRGSGLAKDDPGEPENDEVMIDDLDSWLTFAGEITDQVHLIGFCWGANEALHYLGKRPTGARSLILMAPGIVPSAAVIERHVAQEIPGDGRVPILLDLEDFTRGPMLDGYLRPDPLRLTATSRRFVEIQRRIGSFSAARLLRLRLPSSRSSPRRMRFRTMPRTQRLLEKTSARPNEIEVVDGRHGIIFDAPAEIAAICQNWLTRLAASCRGKTANQAGTP